MQRVKFWNRTFKTGTKPMAFVIVLIVLTTLLSGCAMNGPVRGVDVCGPWRAIYVSAEENLTDETARQILAHNQVGRRLCGW